MFNLERIALQRAVKSSWVLILLLMTACGYHLRGELQLPEILKKVYVQGASPQLTNAVEQVFGSALGEVVDRSAKAGMVLKVLNEDYQRRTISVSSSGYSNEYELVYRLQYEILDKHEELIIPAQTVTATQSYYNAQSSNTLIAKDSEENTLRQEVYKQAVREVVNRARALLKQAYKAHVD